jgi:hypothetical protein
MSKPAEKPNRFPFDAGERVVSFGEDFAVLFCRDKRRGEVLLRLTSYSWILVRAERDIYALCFSFR